VSKIYHMRVPGDITAGVSGPDHAPSWTEFFNCKAPEWMTEGEHEHLSNERLRKDPDKHYSLGFGGAFYVVKGSSDGAEQADHKAAAKAVEILEKRAKQQDEPFFLAVGFVRPHVPLVAPATFFKPYPPATIDVPQVPAGDWDDIPKAGISKNSKSSGIKDDAQKQKILSAYYASVSYMDAQVGKVLAALDRLGLREDTVVVFTADHGYHLGEHDFWQKMGLHDESVRIPILIDAPGKKAGAAATLAEQIDLYPTLCDLAGLPVPKHCRGRSLVPALDDPAAKVRDSAYCLRGKDHLLRTEKWAYMRYKDGSEELYDMVNDPGQFTNLVKTQPAALQELRGNLDAKLAAIAK
jgi:arylsulfatase A-like enzyme